MRDVKVYFVDRGFRPVKGETVAGFYVHKDVHILPSNKIKERGTGWTVTDPNSGNRIGHRFKSREDARVVARKVRQIFTDCGVERSERESSIVSKVRNAGRVDDIKNILKAYSKKKKKA